MIYYDNNYQIHEFNKNNVGWYLKKPRKILNMISKKIIIKLEKEILRLLTNKEFEKKAKKIKGLYEKAKKVAN